MTEQFFSCPGGEGLVGRFEAQQVVPGEVFQSIGAVFGESACCLRRFSLLDDEYIQALVSMSTAAEGIWRENDHVR